MPVPATIEALIIVALVLSPGYVFTQIARRGIAHVQEPTDVRFLLTIITAGTAIHALVFPWTTRVHDAYLSDQVSDRRWEMYAWAAVIIFALPLGLGIAAARLTLRQSVERMLDAIGLGYVDRMPSAWDYVMRQRQPRYVRIHLKDGQAVVGGVFADRSFAALEPTRADIYLEEEWRLDDFGNLIEPFVGSRGIWVSQDVIAYIHLFEGREVPSDGQVESKTESTTVDLDQEAEH